VPKHDDLELLELLGAAGKRDELQQSLQSDVEKRARVASRLEDESAALYGCVRSERVCGRAGILD